MILLIGTALYLLSSVCCCWLLLLSATCFLYLASKTKIPKLKGKYSQPIGPVFHLKRVLITFALASISLARRIKRVKFPQDEYDQDNPQTLGERENSANLSAFYANDKHGNTLSIRFCRRPEGKAEVFMLVRLADGRILSRTGFVCDESPTNGDELDSDMVAADGLRIQMIEPLRTFRILFSGLMALNSRADTLPTDKQYCEVNLRFWCKSLADPSHRTVDYHPWLMAKAIAAEPWSKKLLKYLLKVHEQTERFEQAMEMRGRIDISPIETEESSTEQLELTLHGIRQRIIGDLDLRTIDTAIVHKARFDNGFIVSFVATSLNTTLTHLVEGFLHHPNGFVYAINWTDYHLARLTDDGNVQSKYTINFSAGSKLFSMTVEIVTSDDSPLSPHGKGVLFRSIARFSLSGSSHSSGYGHVELWRLHGDQSTARSLFPRNRLATRRYLVPKTHELEYCLGLTEEGCTNTSLTGGKAAKLAVLMASRNSNDDFEVPAGFAITIEAYYRQIAKHPVLRSNVNRVLEIAEHLSESSKEQTNSELKEELEKACNELVDAFKSTPLSNEVQAIIEKYLSETFGDIDSSRMLLAVRSSAVGEDGSEASGAGQMETFLGVQGKEDVYDKVKQCWASHFAYRAVEYRRQFCGKIDSPMAVLVQRLVPADVAGVLFTRHPDTGSTSRVVINASYGLGESVVSGTVDVDTITVQKLDKIGHNVKIRYDNLGKKDSILKATDQGVVHETNEGSSQCCLSEDEIRRLVKVGESIERIFGAGRDTEFAICRNSAPTPRILILQARPITTADMEQEWELLQELDSPLASDREWATTANLQEVMPDPLCPYGVNGWKDYVSSIFDDRAISLSVKPKRRVQVPRTLIIANQRPFLNCTMAGFVTSKMSKEGLDMAFFGKVIEELKLEDMYEQTDMQSPIFRAFVEMKITLERLFPYAEMLKAEPDIMKMKVTETNDPIEIIREMNDVVLEMIKIAGKGHTNVSEASSIGNAIIMSVLEKDPLKRNETHYGDLALLLSSCTDVFSADVPTMLHAIATSIAESPETKLKFLSMDRKGAAKWLGMKDEGGKSAALFEDFLSKHGHRCVKDADIRSLSWQQEPEKVVDALQTMLRTNEVASASPSKKQLSVDEAIDALQTPLNPFQRFFLKIVVPKVRTAVGRREWSKSLMCKTMDIMRQSVLKLGKILTEQGILADYDLIYFMTFREVDKLVCRRSPRIVARAIRRRKLYPRFLDMHFPEVAVGYPKPIDVTPSIDSTAFQSGSNNIVFKGTSVGLGTITGKARVVTSLTEANAIEHGEILVVPFTDVGWTPYFPLISGLVTELGGLVSHGAVVAREYGLPCIVGCKQATHVVKTGDRITIDCIKGQVIVVHDG